MTGERDAALQIGVVGLGAIGREHVKRLTERITGCTVSAVSEMNQEIGRKTADNYGAKFYADGERSEERRVGKEC